MNAATQRPLILATALGTIAQLAMVLTGHTVPAVANLFAIGGMALSMMAGLMYGILTPANTVTSASRGGAIAGGLAALIGIAVSYALGDVPVWVLAVGTLSSTITGAIGGAVGRVARSRTPVAPAGQVR